MGSTQVSSTKVLLGGIVFFSLAKVVCDEWDECPVMRKTFLWWRLCKFCFPMNLFRRDAI
jgi:hypothetical protein